ncbi:unnamed protein product, partial [Cladocopium goreaui]
MLKCRMIPSGIQAGAVCQDLPQFNAWQLLRRLRACWLADLAEPKHMPGRNGTSFGYGVALCSKPPRITSEGFMEQLQKDLQFPSTVALASRLDKGASGVLPVAWSEPARHWLQAQFASRLVEKEYLCLCEGDPLDSGEIHAPLLQESKGVHTRMVVSEDGQDAHTQYVVTQRFRSPDPSSQELQMMLVRVKTTTGRTHQIRVHMASIGRPLLGDNMYGAGHVLPLHNV